MRIAFITTREKPKDNFTIIDHITHMNAQLLTKLRSEKTDHLVESPCYLNGKIFVLSKQVKRHKIDVTDNIDKKLLV